MPESATNSRVAAGACLVIAEFRGARSGSPLFIAIFLVHGSPFPPILDVEPQADRSEGKETRAANELRSLEQIWCGKAVVQQRCAGNEKKKSNERNDWVPHCDPVERKDSPAPNSLRLSDRREP